MISAICPLRLLRRPPLSDRFHAAGQRGCTAGGDMTAPRRGLEHCATAAAVGLAVLFAAAAPSASAGDGRLTVFAAASLKTALDLAGDRYSEEAGVPVTVSYAATSSLARQIVQGAPADIFFSANRDWMDLLEASGLIDPETRFDALGNTLVLIAHGAAPSPVDFGPDFDLAERLGDGRLAMALVDAVPAGIYGKTALTSLGLWDEVQDLVAQTDNVRTALALVASGEAPYGVVYATDARTEAGVSVVARFPPYSHPPIVYPVAVVTGGDPSLSQDFLAFLTSTTAQAVFAEQGFQILSD